jgi:hypothetical protein
VRATGGVRQQVVLYPSPELQRIKDMIRTISALVGLGATVTALTVARHERADLRQPFASGNASSVVLELYQSQGCSSCPPALDVLRAEADRPNVIALNFAVTYWDELGWKDSFAQPVFTQRQWDYAHANGRNIVATPQLIINGRGFVNGGNRTEVDAAIRQFSSTAAALALKVEGNRLIVGPSADTKPATIWLVSYDPRTINVPIRAGENDGRTLAHRNIVRNLEALGLWKGARMAYALPPIRKDLARAVLVQAGRGGPILAARTLG